MTTTADQAGAEVQVGLDAETLKMTLEAIRDYVASALGEDRQLELDHEDVCPVDLVRGMCSDELGIQLLFIPEEFGGMGGGTIDVYRVCEQMARLDIGVATSVLATFLGSDPIFVGATPEQKRAWLTEIAEKGVLYAYGATEPDAGSDLEIMEMTIARDRWQQHLKSAGSYYREMSSELRALHARHSDVGAGTAALASDALATILEACRVGRLTRNQHVLLRLGELIAWAESAGCFAGRAAAALDGRLPAKADHRFGPEALAPMARVYARDAAQKVACEGLRWVTGAGGTAAIPATSTGLDAVFTAQAGLTADMDLVADALYGRGGPAAQESAESR